MKFDNYMILEFPSKSCNEAFARSAMACFASQMDPTLEESAHIAGARQRQVIWKITLPLVKPAILSTILLVFGSAMGSYPVPHYLGLSTLSTKYVSMNSKYTGEVNMAVSSPAKGTAISCQCSCR